MQAVQQNMEEQKTQFAKELCRLLSLHLGEGFQPEKALVTKNNGVTKQTIVIRQEKVDYAPSFYVDELFHSYQSGIPIDQLADEVAMTVQTEYRKTSLNRKELCSKEWVEQNVYLQLVNKERNKELLKESVSVDVLDLTMVFYVMTQQDANGIKSFRLPKKVWEQLKLGTPEEYLEKAMANTERLFPLMIKNLEDSVIECLNQSSLEVKPPELFSGEDRGVLYVITNTQKINGAVSVLYPEFLSEAEKKYGSFYLIPSSVHEMLLFPEPKEGDKPDLNCMVHEVNEDQLSPEEVLSEHVYYYSIETGLISR